MNTSTLHHQAEELREQDKLLDALKLYEEVVIGYQKEGDYSNLIESLGGRCLTYKHLFLLSNDYSFLNLAKHSALSGLEIAKNFKLSQKYHRCYFRLGEMEMLSGDFSKAVEYYQEAISLYPRDESEKGDFIYHLGEAQFKNGDRKDGLANLLEGLKKIRQYTSVTDSFLIHVWESGCLLRLYSLTGETKYLSEAEKIILGDDRLVIRKRQLKEIKKS